MGGKAKSASKSVSGGGKALSGKGFGRDAVGSISREGKKALGVGTNKNMYNYNDTKKRPEPLKYGPSAVNKSGTLKKGYQIKPQKLEEITQDQRGMDAFRAEALRTGPSAWLNNQLEQQKIQEAGAGENAAALGAGQQAQARSSLASKGGLTGGASERLAGMGARDQMMERQRIAREGQTSRLGLQSDDERNRLDTLGKLPGMETAWIQPRVQQQQFGAEQDLSAQGANSQLRSNELSSQRDFDRGQYNESMEEWARNRQGKAIGAQGERQGISRWFSGPPGGYA